MIILLVKGIHSRDIPHLYNGSLKKLDGIIFYKVGYYYIEIWMPIAQVRTYILQKGKIWGSGKILQIDINWLLVII